MEAVDLRRWLIIEFIYGDSSLFDVIDADVDEELDEKSPGRRCSHDRSL